MLSCLVCRVTLLVDRRLMVSRAVISDDVGAGGPRAWSIVEPVFHEVSWLHVALLSDMTLARPFLYRKPRRRPLSMARPQYRGRRHDIAETEPHRAQPRRRATRRTDKRIVWRMTL